jgi:hypothetical protein
VLDAVVDRDAHRWDASSGSAGSMVTEQVKVAKKDVDNAR